MILAVCVDDRLGMRFNGRRQSRDRAVFDDLLGLGCVRIHPDSEKIFPGAQASEGYLSEAGAGEICFCEDDAYLDHAQRIEKIILYKWNRTYPRDLCFTFPGKWRLAESRDLAGSSHEMITREVYIQ